MAVYSESTLTDLGYVDGYGEALASIEGRDNCGRCDDGTGHICCCFRHLGVTGYPDVATSFRDEIPGTSVISISETLPTGAQELTEQQFLARLVEAYGWSANTYMGVDGRPHGPDIVTVDNAFYQVEG